MNLRRHAQGLPDYLEYLVDAENERFWERDDEGISKGLQDLDEGRWWSVKDDFDPHYMVWRNYLGELREQFGDHVTLHRMLPDGTFEPWEVVND